MADDRFPPHSEEDLNKILEEKDSKNTKKATQVAVNVLESFMVARNMIKVGSDPPEADDWTLFTKPQLASLLRQFYAEARTVKGELYKKTTLLSLRNGINRHLNTSLRQQAENNENVMSVDLTKDPDFVPANDMLKAMKKVLKKNNKAAIIHYPPVDTADLVLMRQYFLQNYRHSPKALQQQVFVNVMVHFARRGRENLLALKISDFAITSDSTGTLFVYETCDELTKNHQDDDDYKDARMYQVKGK